MSEQIRQKSGGFVVQAGILALSGIVVRMIGLLYRSPLTSIIGDEGNGYYSYAYNIYAIILLVSSYSIPSALSKVLAQRLTFREYKNAHRVFQCALFYVVVVGGAASLAAFFAAPFLVGENSVAVLRVFAPTIFFSGLVGVLRGYFQAYGSMVQTSLSQILEQIVNAAVSVGAAWYLAYRVAGEDADATTRAIYGACGGAIGTGAGVLTALLFMLWVYWLNLPVMKRKVRRDKAKEEDRGQIYKSILLIVTPFILSTFIYNLSTSLNQEIHSRIYTQVKGMEEAAVASLYGIYAGKAVVISNIPIALASAMSSAVIPTVAGSFSRKEYERTRGNVRKAVKVTMLISIPSAVGLFTLARPIMQILFWQRNSLDQSARVLAALSVTVVFYGLSTLTNGILQGIGKVTAPVLHAAAALVLQTVVLVALLMFTDLNLYALVLATVCYSFSMCVMNGAAVRKHLGYRQEVKRTFLLPALSALVMGAAGRGVYEGVYALLRLAVRQEGGYVQNLVAAASALVVAVAVYFVCVIKFRAVTQEELAAMPKGATVVRMARKARLL